MKTYTEWRNAIRREHPLARFVESDYPEDICISAYDEDGIYLGSFEILDAGCSNTKGYGESYK